jgi:hypothetical protein
MITGPGGVLKARYDYFPFGEYIPIKIQIATASGFVRRHRASANVEIIVRLPDGAQEPTSTLTSSGTGLESVIIVHSLRQVGVDRFSFRRDGECGRYVVCFSLGGGSRVQAATRPIRNHFADSLAGCAGDLQFGGADNVVRTAVASHAPCGDAGWEIE